MQLPWTLAGLPLVTIPIDDLPVAIQLAGRWYCDERLLELGRLAEEILAGRSLTTSAARTGSAAAVA